MTKLFNTAKLKMGWVMRLRKALATKGSYLILAMAKALNRSTYVYIEDIYKSKGDTRPSHCLGLHSKSSLPAGSQ